MALCRLEAKIISRSGGRSTVGSASYRTGKCAVAAVAYRMGAELKDERTGQVYDYSRKRGVLGAEIMLPAGAPEWMQDRGSLWNAVEKAEKRADAQLARDFILSLPHELDAEARRALTQQFVQERFVDRGYAADIAWHAPHGKGDERNHHAHVMVVMRRIDGNGFAATKERPPEGKHPAEHWKAELRGLREAWANTGADALAKAGFELEATRFRLGHMTLEKQREAAVARGDMAWAETLDREAEPKQGPLATKIEREGRESHAGADRRDAQARNAERARLKLEHAQISAEIFDLEAERRKRTMDETPEALAGRIRQSFEEAAKLYQPQVEQQQRLREAAERYQKEAQEAEARRRKDQEDETVRRAQGDIADAHARERIALGQVAQSPNPYTMMANASLKSLGIFTQQQESLREQAAELARAGKQEEARLVEFNRRVQSSEWMAVQYEKSIRINTALSGRDDNPTSLRDAEHRRVFLEDARKHRGEREALTRDMLRRRGAETSGKVERAAPGQEAAKDRDRLRRQHEDDAAKRAGLEPGQAPESNPGNREQRELRNRETREQPSFRWKDAPADDKLTSDAKGQGAGKGAGRLKGGGGYSGGL